MNRNSEDLPCVTYKNASNASVRCKTLVCAITHAPRQACDTAQGECHATQTRPKSAAGDIGTRCEDASKDEGVIDKYG